MIFTRKKQFINGGAKMRKWVHAAYEAWKLAGSIGEPMLMQRVAEAVIAASPGPVIAHVRTLRDELLTCIDDTGPCFAHKRDTYSPLKLRLTRDFLVTMDFLNEFFRCLILEQGHVKAAMRRYHEKIALGGSMFAGIVPANHGIIHKMVELVIDSPFAKEKANSFIQSECDRSEWRSLAIDGTRKIANAQKTQATATTARAKKHNQALADKYAKYYVVAVLGISGRVANFRQVHTEGSSGIVDVLVETFTREQRLTVKHVCTDSPTPAQYAQLKKVLPNLQCISLDPMHICYKFNRSQGKDQGPAG